MKHIKLYEEFVNEAAEPKFVVHKGAAVMGYASSKVQARQNAKAQGAEYSTVEDYKEQYGDKFITEAAEVNEEKDHTISGIEDSVISGLSGWVGLKNSELGKIIYQDKKAQASLIAFEKAVKPVLDSLNEGIKYNYNDLLDTLDALPGSGKIQKRIKETDPEVEELLSVEYRDLPSFADAVASMYKLRKW